MQLTKVQKRPAAHNQESWPSYGLDQRLLVQVVSETYGLRIPAKAFLKSLKRRLIGSRERFEAAAVYNGLAVFHREGLNGGGPTHGLNVPRVLLELGLKRCDRLFEFCAGPGYIGYNLLANGFCEHLVLADINPVAVEAAKYTAKFNGIEHRVTTYVSDCLSQIPADERWDMVVGNPPTLLPGGREDDILSNDPDWKVHKSFYASIKRFMKPGGHVMMVEDRGFSAPELFEPMILNGGGKLVATLPGKNLRGQDFEKYYMLSEW